MPLAGLAPDQRLHLRHDVFGHRAHAFGVRTCGLDVDRFADHAVVATAWTLVERTNDDRRSRPQREDGRTVREHRFLTEELDLDTGASDVTVGDESDCGAGAER